MSAGRGARASRPHDPVLEEARGVVAAVVARFVRARFAHVDRAELEQEAWAAVLASRDGFDPTRGKPAEAYFRVIVRRALGRYVSAALAVVSIGKHYEMARHLQGRVPGDGGWEGAARGGSTWVRGANRGGASTAADYEEVVRDKLVDNPEVRLMKQQEDRKMEVWRQKVRDMLASTLAGWTAYDRFIVTRLGGLDGYRAERPGELAQRLKIDVVRVYKVHSRLEKALWDNHRLYIMHKRGPTGGA